MAVVNIQFAIFYIQIPGIAGSPLRGDWLVLAGSDQARPTDLVDSIPMRSMRSQALSPLV
ncbi:hypothetical protein D1AOALGA4SA_3021 [Olavius algarvensis Delta 1 endosymbiont]|nr:hypothetical protein D1AOALGA4SA_3021 [Olavius algarvensis Delta 1 endosymbiont]